MHIWDNKTEHEERAFKKIDFTEFLTFCGIWVNSLEKTKDLSQATCESCILLRFEQDASHSKRI